MVRYDFLGRGRAEVNINLAPRERGKGWASRVISECNGWLKESQGIGTFIAKIKRDNVGSIKVFQKAGFNLLEKQRNLLTFQKGGE